MMLRPLCYRLVPVLGEYAALDVPGLWVRAQKSWCWVFRDYCLDFTVPVLCLGAH